MNKYLIVGIIAAILVFATIATTTWPVQARKAGGDPLVACLSVPCAPGHEDGPANHQDEDASEFAPGE